MSYRVYVGTYAKYNNGSIFGKWFDLEDYASKEDFLNDATELHSDEDDPELMFQDWEGVPAKYISESYIDKGFWDEFLNEIIDDADLRVVEAFWTGVDENASPRDALDAYAGTYSTRADWAEEFIENAGYNIDESLAPYINYDAYARDASYGGGTTFVDMNDGVYVFYT